MILFALTLLVGDLPKSDGLAQRLTIEGNAAEWITPDDYPSLAIREGTEGIVGFRLSVSAEGKVSTCEILQSSGSSLLDGTTCGLVMSRAKFRPALDNKGRPMPSTYAGRVRWQMPDMTNEKNFSSMFAKFVGDGKKGECLQTTEFVSVIQFAVPPLLSPIVSECRSLVSPDAPILNLPAAQMKSYRRQAEAAKKPALAAIRKASGIRNDVKDADLLNSMQELPSLGMTQDSCTTAGEMVPLLSPLPTFNLGKILAVIFKRPESDAPAVICRS